MTIFDFDDYRKYLSALLQVRRQRNPSYSLRAIAKSLGISSSGLSEILRGKTNLSAQQTGRVGQRLGLQRTELDYFCSLVLYTQTQDDTVKGSLFANLKSFNHGAHLSPNLALIRTVLAWYSSAVQEFSDVPKLNINARETQCGKARLMEFHNLLIAMVAMLPAISDGRSANVPDLTGLYACPAYSGSDNSWGAHRVRITQNTLGGIPVIISQEMGLPDKTGPYDISVEIADGQWRYTPLFRNNTLYPMKVKAWIDNNKIHWESDVPAYIDNKGNPREAKKGSGSQWLNADGDLVSVGSHYTGEYVCKRISEKDKN